jgi:polyhydroxyalkanoate synthesis regulator protein
MWTQFMNMQAPLMQGMMGSSLEQSKTLLTQMQEAMQKQTEQVLGSFGLKR